VQPRRIAIKAALRVPVVVQEPAALAPVVQEAALVVREAVLVVALVAAPAVVLAAATNKATSV
jgi:hypothetical protein